MGNNTGGRYISIYVYIYVFVTLPGMVQGSCAMWNYCNGHGTCNERTSVCACDVGYGAATDITSYRSPDCSARTCPAGVAWSDLATDTNAAHAVTECSNRGTCNRETGECKCLPGFTGPSCHRTKCPNDCSGHGRCYSMKQLARLDEALPLNNNTNYENREGTTTWDESALYGCLCDSTWPVGIQSGETQVAEWFGADCSRRHCPSGDDPYTPDVDETDCEGVAASSIGLNGVNGTGPLGKKGNLCHVECSHRGRCDYQTGLCACYDSYSGTNCADFY